MAFLILRKLIGYRLLCTLILFFLLFTCLNYYVKEELFYSAILDSSFITFDDFDQKYSTALNVSKAEDKPIRYDYPPSSTAQIPPILHRIWFTGISRDVAIHTEDIPPIWAEAAYYCKEANTNYTFFTWSAEAGHDFLQKNYAWFLPTYDAYKFPIQRVDALKYFLLWHYGGIYLDLDIGCRRSLDPLREFSAVLPRALPLGVNNDMMASRPGHPVFAQMLHSLQTYNYNYFFSYPTVFWSTGPMFVNTVVKDYWFRDDKRAGKPSAEWSINTINNHTFSVKGSAEEGDSLRRYSGPGDIAILPRIFYSEEYSFFGHYPGGSWHGDDVFVVIWIWNRLWAVFGVMFIFAAVILQARRLRRKRMIAYRKMDLIA